jgi:hypothetical protein
MKCNPKTDLWRLKVHQKCWITWVDPRKVDDPRWDYVCTSEPAVFYGTYWITEYSDHMVREVLSFRI